MPKALALIMLCATALLQLSGHAIAQERTTVDDADSLNFQDFHEEDGDGISLFGGEKEPDDADATLVDVSREESSGGLVSQPILPGSGSELRDQKHTPGELYIIRARYSLNPANLDQYDLFEAIVMLNKQMNTLCPLGWEKDKEWMQPIEGDYFLHYRFECLDPEEFLGS